MESNEKTYIFSERALDSYVKTVQKIARLEERNACAKICEDFADVDSGPDGIMQDYHAHLIRSRGEE
jgi:hypothetical protein